MKNHWSRWFVLAAFAALVGIVIAAPSAHAAPVAIVFAGDIVHPTGNILEPEADEIVVGEASLVAVYDDGNDDNDDVARWAVRQGTCAAGVGTVFGNVDGHSDPYAWDGAAFSAVVDTASLTPGKYCFVFNPEDDPGQNDVRLTREFWVADAYLHGGGHLLEKVGNKRKQWHDVSFGGWLADVGARMGDWTVQFHNVGNDEFDGATFHAASFTALNLFDGDSATCTDAFNFTALGSLDGEDGWKVIVRGGDLDAPASQNPDTLRVELYDGNTPVYDTHGGDFEDESDCVGTARTRIDAGNITIVR